MQVTNLSAHIDYIFLQDGMPCTEGGQTKPGVAGIRGYHNPDRLCNKELCSWATVVSDVSKIETVHCLQFEQLISGFSTTVESCSSSVKVSSASIYYPFNRNAPAHLQTYKCMHLLTKFSSVLVLHRNVFLEIIPLQNAAQLDLR